MLMERRLDPGSSQTEHHPGLGGFHAEATEYVCNLRRYHGLLSIFLSRFGIDRALARKLDGFAITRNLTNGIQRSQYGKLT